MAALHPVALLIQIGVIALGMALGLDATVDDILYLARRPAKLGRAFLAICVVVPAVAALTMGLLPVIGAVKAGVLLTAAAPVPPLAPPRALRTGGRRPYVYGLYVAFAALTIVTVPITLVILARLFGVTVRVPVTELGKSIFVTVLAPIGVGMLVRKAWPSAAARLSGPISNAAVVLLIALVILILIRTGPLILELFGNGGVAAMLIIGVVGAFCGHWLGGPEPADRATLAAAAAMRHPGIALMLVAANFPNSRVQAAVVLFTLVTAAVASIYSAAMRRRVLAPR